DLRSLEMIIGILGILKAGGAYLPIDPEYPEERIDFMLRDSGTRIIVNNALNVGSFYSPLERGTRRRRGGGVEAEETVSYKVDQLCYVIYTSGSTGKPKGVIVEHASVLNLAFSQMKRFNIDQEERILQFSSICFDASVEQVFIALFSGAVLVLIHKEEMLDAGRFETFIQRHSVSHIHAVPSFLNSVKINDSPHLKRIIAGGDVCPAALAEKFSRYRYPDFYNEYGPTETTVTSLMMKVEGVDGTLPRIPVGGPIHNTALYLLDKGRQPVPIGVPGELYIAGDGVARGYLNQPELTAERFVKIEISSNGNDISFLGNKLYKTGDLARWLPDGNVEFLGRTDRQVKIRGFRIEPGEIERRLLHHPHIKEAVVMVKGMELGEQEELTAYFVYRTGLPHRIDPDELREQLSQSLPRYMIPSYFVSLPQIPLNANQKIDFNALDSLDTGLQHRAITDHYAAPRNKTEKKLTEIWEEVLGHQPIGIRDNFFSSGGHSLNALRMVTRIYKELYVEIGVSQIFKHPTITQLAPVIKQKDPSRFIEIEAVEERDYYDVSNAQRRLWVLHQLENERTAYNMSAAFMLKGPLNIPALNEAFLYLIQRHESLRTGFRSIDGKPRQIIRQTLDFKLECRDVPDKKAALEIAARHAAIVFDLACPPLFNVQLLKLERTEHILLFNMHHIIADGWSTGILFHDLPIFYNRSEDPGTILPPPVIQYKDYARWQNQILEEEKINAVKEYWLRQFPPGNPVPVVDLPADYPRPPVRTYNGNSIHRALEAPLASAINTLCQQQGITLFMALSAAVNLLIYRYTGQEEIITGSPVAGRDHPDLEDQVGYYVNTLPLRQKINGNDNVGVFLRQVGETAAQAYENQIYPFDQLVDQLNLVRDTSRHPLFDVMVILQNNRQWELQLDGIDIAALQNHYNTSKFDLTVEAVERENDISITIGYNTDLFKEERVRRFSDHFTHLLEGLTRDPEQEIGTIDILTPGEKHRLLIEFNNTNTHYPVNKTIGQIFEGRVDNTPDSIAVVFRNKSLTYRSLNEKANRLAWVLAERGVRPGTIVGLKLERSLEMIVGILGILKAGGAYLPIDPDYPEERIDFMLRDSGARIVLTHGGSEFNPNSLEYQSNSSSHLPTFPPSNLAYLIYTSGSTGRPKSVAIAHTGFINMSLAQIDAFNVTLADRVLQFASFSFDASVSEIFMALFSGASLVLLHDRQITDTGEFINMLNRHNISVLTLPPAYLRQLKPVPGNPLKGIKTLITAGEPPDPADVAYYSETTNYFNAYGPTEAAVCATYYQFPPGCGEGMIIGSPIANTSVYILDKKRNLLPEGISGEICINGPGLALGYLNNPELSAQRFIPHPFKPGELLYKTGDLGRWLPDGNIEFLGRVDDQVKIRGFRIELGEIQYRLLEHPRVKEVVVTAEAMKEQKELFAFVVTVDRDCEMNSPAFREHLGQFLPHYMIPSHFIQLEQLPLTTNGKIDKTALQRLATDNNQSPINDLYEAPRNKTEETLVVIWQEVLNREPIGITDNFFETGGDSIKAIQIASKSHKYGIMLDVGDLFRHPVIKELSKLVGNAGKKPPNLQPVQVTGEVELTPIQKWFHESTFTDPHHFNQAVFLYREEGFSQERVEQCFRHILRHHDALRMVYEIRDNQVVQRNRGIEGEEELFHLEVIHPEASISPGEFEKIVAREANKVQRSIDLQTGPLVKLVLFKGTGDYLLIVIHHLVIDGVSWRILLEDFGAAYEALEKGQAIRLQDKTDSFQYWAAKQAEYARSREIRRELEYWKQLSERDVSILPKDSRKNGNEGECKYKDNETVTLDFSPMETRQLLEQTNRAYNTQVNDLLLTALALSLQNMWGMDNILINLEGHGRETIIEGIDINRTVGWFTSQFPVLLELSKYDNPGNNLSYQIRYIKETLRKIPGKGIGFGILKYLSPHREEFAAAKHPEINFNYLGDFGQRENYGNGIFSVSGLSAGDNISPRMKNLYVLDISGMVTDGALSLRFQYNKRQYSKSTIQTLASRYRAALLEIIRHCSTLEQPQLTPADYGLSRFPSTLTLENLAHIIRLHGRDIQKIYPLSPMQEGFLFHWLKEPGENAYFEQFTLHLEGEVDRLILEKSIGTMVNRHDILRTLFVYKDIETPVQVVLKHQPISLFYRDPPSSSNGGGPQREIKNYCAEDKLKAVDLTKGPLMRFALFKLDETSFVLIWSHHHIIMDGWCIDIFFRELFLVYRGLLNRQAIPLEPAVPFKHYIDWLGKQDKEEGLNHWEKILAGYDRQISLPRSEHPPGESRKRYRLEEYRLHLEEEETSLFSETAALHRVTVNTLFQTLWAILLMRYNNTRDVVFGSVVSGRSAKVEGIENIMGVFINTLPVRIRTNPGQVFKELVKEVQFQSLQSKTRQYLPLSEIQSKSLLKADLINHIIVFENYPIDEELKSAPRETQNSPGFWIKRVEALEQTNYDLNVLVIPGKRLTVTFNYNALIYSSDIIKQVSRHFSRGMQAVTGNKDIKINDIDILTHEERQQLLTGFNNTRTGYPEDKSIVDIFGEQVEKKPDHIAVKNGESEGRGGHGITYRELNEKSNRVAFYLREHYTVQSGQPVGIMMHRGEEMVVAVMGILKAGAAYLPIDPQYPVERIEYMLKDSNATCCISDDWNEAKGNDQLLMKLQPFSALSAPSAVKSGYEPAPCTLHPANPAYVIYTSGSTGKPKGVMIPHRNVVRLFFTRRPLFDFNSRDIWTMFHSLSFDFSVWEIFGALLFGGKVVIIPELVAKTPARYLALLRNCRVTVLNQTPSAFYNLQDEELTRQDKSLALRYIIFGGEALKPRRLKQWQAKYPRTKLINMYGITETTVHVTYKEITPADIETGSSNIGSPIPTLGTFLLDRDSRLVPSGVAGELCVGGAGLAIGYLNRPELTGEKFIDNPFEPGQRLYRSGDMARVLESGDMEYQGRMDKQIQLHGFRVELGEIEAQIQTYDGIHEAVVIAEDSKSGAPYLSAYVVPANGNPTHGLREYLAEKLPSYMVPSYFFSIPKIPLTPNGKVDTKALARLKPRNNGGNSPPVNETQSQLATIWKKQLNLEEVGIKDNYFNIGGDSIRAIRLINTINNQFKTNLEIVDLYSDETIENLSRRINRSNKPHITQQGKSLEDARHEVETIKLQFMAHNQITGNEIEDIYPMSDIQKGMAYHGLQTPGEAVYHDQFVYQLYYPRFDPVKFKQALRLMVKKHPMLRTAFHFAQTGPDVQMVHQNILINIPHEDISSMAKHEQEEYLKRSMAEDRQAPLNLEIPPLWRMKTFHAGAGNIVILWSFHHAILDGWSNASFFVELNDIYSQMIRGRDIHTGNGFPALKSNYKDFIIHQLTEKKKTGNHEFWKEELSGYRRLDIAAVKPDIKTNNPQDHPPPGQLRFLRLGLGEQRLKKLEETAAVHHTSVKNLTFAAYIYMLNLLSYENDLVAGLVTNNRPICEDGDKILGCFLNTIPFRVKIPSSLTWTQYIHLINKKMARLKRYEGFPFFEIAKFGNKKSPGVNPVFDTLFNYVDFHVYSRTRNGRDVLSLEGYEKTNTLFDVTVSTTAGDFVLHIKYNDSVINQSMVEQCCRYYENIIDQFLHQPEDIADSFTILTQSEKHRLLTLFNETKAGFPMEKTIVDLFRDQVEKTPGSIAVTQFAQSLSYRELNRRVHRLALLLQENGTGAGMIAAIMVERSLEMIVGLFGILKAGAAYLPIDPNYPQERIDFMLRDSGAGVLICSGRPHSDTPHPSGAPLSRGELAEVLLIDLRGINESSHTSQEEGKSLSAASLNSPLERG
ncbi:MAG: amino acid adenylation domain-containing protein, partial [bacterium]|nr:amino acid adenylation domain-containing protein [bacterium]